MTNIYITDSDEETIVDFVKDHEKLYGKTSRRFQGLSKEGVSLGAVHQQLQAVCQGLQNLV